MIALSPSGAQPAAIVRTIRTTMGSAAARPVHRTRACSRSHARTFRATAGRRRGRPTRAGAGDAGGERRSGAPVGTWAIAPESSPRLDDVGRIWPSGPALVRRRAEPAAPRRLEPEPGAGPQRPRRLRLEILAVEEVAPAGAGRAAVRAGRRVPAPLREQR